MSCISFAVLASYSFFRLVKVGHVCLISDVYTFSWVSEKCNYSKRPFTNYVDKFLAFAWLRLVAVGCGFHTRPSKRGAPDENNVSNNVIPFFTLFK